MKKDGNIGERDEYSRVAVLTEGELRVAVDGHDDGIVFLNIGQTGACGLVLAHVYDVSMGRIWVCEEIPTIEEGLTLIVIYKLKVAFVKRDDGSC